LIAMNSSRTRGASPDANGRMVMSVPNSIVGSEFYVVANVIGSRDDAIL
jgi:hypothetical protein